jgi:DNA-binding NtrC family response regulator
VSDATLTILIVEDEPVVRMLLVEEFSESGFSVLEAGSIAEARNAVRGLDRLSAAVIDRGLPDGNGIDLAAELGATYPKLPLVIASGYGSSEPSDALEGDGAIVQITKPFDPEVIVSVIENLISKSSEGTGQSSA